MIDQTNLQTTHTVGRFSQCIACSARVLAAYAAEGDAFVRRVCNEPRSLEVLTGLDVLQEQANAADVLEFGDECMVSCSSQSTD